MHAAVLELDSDAGREGVDSSCLSSVFHRHSDCLRVQSIILGDQIAGDLRELGLG